MVLRCTTKVLGLLGVRPAALAEMPPSDDDWYVNLLWIERRKCLLLTHVRTLFPIVVADVRKADVVPIGPYVVGLIEGELASEGVALDAAGHLDAADVRLAKTASRSILGVMNNTALLIRYRVAAMGGIDYAMDIINRFLRRTPHQREGEWVWPAELSAPRPPIRRFEPGGRPVSRERPTCGRRPVAKVGSGRGARGAGGSTRAQAERAGFEPATHLSARTRFPVALLRPLGHLSVASLA